MPTLMMGAALERVEDPLQGRIIKSLAAVLYFEADFCRIAGYHHAYRRARRAILDCIHDQVSEQLLQTLPVPDTFGVAHDLQIEPVLRMRSSMTGAWPSARPPSGSSTRRTRARGPLVIRRSTVMSPRNA